MPRGTTRNSGSSGENVSHFNGIRIRVAGTGALKLTLFSLDDIQWNQLADIDMSERTNIQPTRYSNFVEQRASLELKTVMINDYFKINRIIIFSRFFATQYPQ
jgi:hypothetical protein